MQNVKNTLTYGTKGTQRKHEMWKTRNSCNNPHAPGPAAGQQKGTLNTKAPEFTLPTTPLRQDIVNGSGDTVSHVAAEGDSYTIAKANYEPRADFWEKMELRMMQPPAAPTPFDGDPSW